MKDIFKRLFSSQSAPSGDDHIPSFNEQQAKEEDVQFIDHGIQTIALENIIGSVGKYADFDSRFRPKKHVAGKRFTQIKQAMRQGKKIPPVKLYQIRNQFYVLDGNHRVAAAKELGWTELCAKVVELLSGKNTMENLLYIEKKKFFDKTGLPGEIDLTEVGKYNYLEQQIHTHQMHLAAQSGRDHDFSKAARDWYNTIYLPLIFIIKNGGLIKYFPGRTMADLYTYIAYHHWDTNSDRRYGIGIDRLIPKSMEAFRTAMLEKQTPEYPEMKRSITAFILIDTDTTAEFTLSDKLFALEEVQEVHAVHGSIDLLVKVVLQRDFLTSDAETIAEFLDQHIRKIAGIKRTQTMIPGRSLVKENF
ncbi:MAG: Lrp/AsnC ligand binding domain-containing protein [Desulfotignum sp.]|nr:Lrp/AsnC ligand binding domain-containing protein [Desulfobacteraceae bacterium]